MNYSLDPQRRKEKVAPERCSLLICGNPLPSGRVYTDNHKTGRKFCSMRCCLIWKEMKKSIKEGD